MKYLVYVNKNFFEFDSWEDANYFMLDKEGSICKKITSKKCEDKFREACLNYKETKNKIYVVIFNNEVKRFKEWKEAEKFIKGKQGCKYRGFSSEEEAQNYININVKGKTSSQALKCQTDIKGNVFLIKDGKKTQIGKVDTVLPIERELTGTLLGIKEAINRKEEQIVIEYKNQGVEMWANGTWKTNKPYTINYQNEINNLKKYINIDFKELKQ